jgi:hypothetical protein
VVGGRIEGGARGVGLKRAVTLLAIAMMRKSEAVHCYSITNITAFLSP